MNLTSASKYYVNNYKIIFYNIIIFFTLTYNIVF